MLKVLLSFVAASVAAIAGLVLAVAALFQDIVVHMSLLALTLSILSAFKEDIFPFRPIVPLTRDHHGSAKRAFPQQHCAHTTAQIHQQGSRGAR